MKKFFAVFILVFLVCQVQAADYTNREDVSEFIDELVTKENFDRAALEAVFAQAEKKESIIKAISRPAEKVKPWKDYRKIFVTDTRAEQGVAFWKKHASVIEDVSRAMEVEPEIIVAIIGVETRYGENTGSYRVIDALSTLAFDYPPRGSFFRGQLKEFFLLAREQHQPPLSLKGSYAGAMGYGQFIPSSYRAYAVDFDQDDFADIWNNPADAIASVANYFKRHGWEQGEPVISRCLLSEDADKSVVTEGLKPDSTVGELIAKGFTPVDDLPPETAAALYELEGEYGPEYWMGLNNFYVITRYNHSNMYALSVYQLSQDILRLMES
ncbi:MAG: lytic murein transglycosylase B [Pseudomonadales bacterium]|nr:lytic murein transglycosylase B [Pseudomonadales bacterium]